jgi:hypothetical protein
MTDFRDHYECFIKVKTADGEKPCGRPRAKLTDLCCAEHWKMVPKKLRQPLVDANRERSYRDRERLSIAAATKVVEYIKGMFIQLPPVARIETPAGEDLKVGPLVQAEERGLVKSPNLIIPGR